MTERDPSFDWATRSATHEGTAQTAEPAAGPAIGARLGTFRVEARIGEGGLGIVYRAYDEKLKRPVALKVLADSSSAAATHLLEEARAAAALTHPSIAAIHDVQRQSGCVFIVMELVPGHTLREELRHGPLPPAVAVRHARDIASGLARAHASGVVHRDLKPENVMVTPDGHVKILDFGLARTMPDDAPPSSEVGATGIAGTPDYMAPEQAGGRRADARADVFSFGVVLYEMLTGKRPFPRRKRIPVPGEAGGRAAEWTIVEPLESAAPKAPRELVPIVERCLAFDRSARFADGAALLAALTAAAGGPERVAARAGKLVAWGAGATAVLIVAGLGVRAASRSTAPLGSVAAPSAPASPPAPTLTSPATPLTHAALCAQWPIFVDDHTLVYSLQDADRTELHRLDLSSGEDRALTDAHQVSQHPGPGASGQVAFLYRKNDDDIPLELKSVSLEGGPTTTLGRGMDPIVVGSDLYYVQEDGRALRRKRLEGGDDTVVVAAPPSIDFESLAMTSDARWIATSETERLGWTRKNVCVGPLGGPTGTTLDCASAGATTGRRMTFSPDGTALYYAQGASLVRYDRTARSRTSTRVEPAPTTFAFAPDGQTLVFSDCHLVYDALRVALDGTPMTLPEVGDQVGVQRVGPRGELAYPVDRNGSAALAVTDPAGGGLLVLSGTNQQVNEAAFSPDGARIVYHDSSPETGGLYVAGVTGTRAALRVTNHIEDHMAVWLDSDRIAFARPEKGLPVGQIHVVSAAGGEAQPLPKVPGGLIGAVPSRGTLLLEMTSPTGDRLAESTLDGRLRYPSLRGLPREVHWNVVVLASPSGRYVTWFDGGLAWRADLEKGTASRVTFPRPPGDADSIQPDDSGAVTFSYRHSQGQLYRAGGRFP